MAIKRIIIGIIFLFSIFILYRLVRPLQIFVVSPEFELPIDVGKTPEGVESISAKSCGKCHVEIFKEWSSSMHAKAWTDPYFRVDFAFDGNLQICLNCHTPLKDQQPNLVTGFMDSSKFKPVLKDNPDFDPELQDEGVTCAVCHIRDGVIIGPSGSSEAPHIVRRDKNMADGHSICKRCHMVMGDSWDTFYRFPPCGTFAEVSDSGREPECTKCHMPEIRRPLVPGGEVMNERQHIWRGGHEPDMVKKGLTIELESEEKGKGNIVLFLTNSGSNHTIPTGTPDRHLTVTFTLIDEDMKTIKKKNHKLKRTIMWRPFIVDLWDTRLKAGKTREFPFAFNKKSKAVFLDVEVRYHLLDDKRRRRIGYENKDPINYRVFYKRIDLIESGGDL